MILERRRQERKIPKGFTFIQLEQDDGGRILNVSEEGLSFETFSPVRQADPVHFWFSFNLHDRIDVLGRIAWLDATKTVGGIRFVGVSQNAQKQIRAWMGKNSSADRAARPQGAPKAPPVDVYSVCPNSPERPRERDYVKIPSSLKPPALDSAINFGKSAPLLQEAVPESFKGTELVPLERYLSATRSRFIRGVLLGVLASFVLAIPVFKYVSAQKHRVFVQGTPEGAVPASPTAPTKPEVPAPSSIPTISPFSSPSTLAKSQHPKPSSYRPDSSVKPAPVVQRLQSPAMSPGNTGSRLPEPLPTDVAKRTKKSSATPRQLWASVQAGNASAAVLLADLYIHGDGVPANCDQARVLLLVASEKNNQDAIRKLRDLDKTGCPQP